MDLPAFSIDGDWVDMCSFLAGVIHIVYRRYDNANNGNLISTMTAIQYATGVAIFPQLLLTFCVFSSQLERSLLAASKISLSVAGAFALVALLEKP